jgi:hypothetical protein
MRRTAARSVSSLSSADLRASAGAIACSTTGRTPVQTASPRCSANARELVELLVTEADLEVDPEPIVGRSRSRSRKSKRSGLRCQHGPKGALGVEVG